MQTVKFLQTQHANQEKISNQLLTFTSGHEWNTFIKLNSRIYECKHRRFPHRTNLPTCWPPKDVLRTFIKFKLQNAIVPNLFYHWLWVITKEIAAQLLNWMIFHHPKPWCPKSTETDFSIHHSDVRNTSAAQLWIPKVTFKFNYEMQIFVMPTWTAIMLSLLFEFNGDKATNILSLYSLFFFQIEVVCKTFKNWTEFKFKRKTLMWYFQSKPIAHMNKY